VRLGDLPVLQSGWRDAQLGGARSGRCRAAPQIGRKEVFEVMDGEDYWSVRGTAGQHSGHWACIETHLFCSVGPRHVPTARAVWAATDKSGPRILSAYVI
jgi:hypothetical protein